MQRFIPYEKLSKRKKRELDRMQRGTWGGFDPVTRKPPLSRAYRRVKARREQQALRRIYS